MAECGLMAGWVCRDSGACVGFNQCLCDAIMLWCSVCDWRFRGARLFVKAEFDVL